VGLAERKVRWREIDMAAEGQRESGGTGAADAQPGPVPGPPSDPEHPRRPFVGVGLAALALAALILIAYWNGLRAPFLMDDVPNIVNNAPLHDGGPASWRLIDLPRRLVAATFALDWRLGGTETLGYHLTNLVIHLVNGVLAFLVLRRTLASPRLAPRFGAAAGLMALIAAAIFVVHPVQPQAVTYIVQRCESLMATFALAALWCVARAAETPAGHRAWSYLAAFACALACSCKESVVVMPVLLLAYDRVFLAASWREVRDRRASLHLAVTAVTVLVVAVDLAAAHARTGERPAGFSGAPATSWTYLLTEATVIPHYGALMLGLARPCFDYAWPIVTDWRAAAGGGLLVLACVGATAVALWRAPAAGFAGLAFFALLAPTSSFVPVADAAFDQRLYLPILAVAGLVVAAAHAAARRLSSPRTAAIVTTVLAGCAIVGLSARTVTRNGEFSDAGRLWQATIRERPGNARAHLNLGCVLSERGHPDQAIASFTRALELEPDYVDAHVALGTALAGTGRMDEAGIHLRRAVAVAPRDPRAQAALGQWLQRSGDFAAAETSFRAALALDPSQPTALLGLAILAYRTGDLAHAVPLARLVAASTVGQETANAYALIGAIARDQERMPEAQAALERAVALDPSHQGARTMLALTYAALGRSDDASRSIEAALAIDPTNEFALQARGLIESGGAP
jgi:Flp pilus assembly protein TadD